MIAFRNAIHAPGFVLHVRLLCTKNTGIEHDVVHVFLVFQKVPPFVIAKQVLWLEVMHPPQLHVETPLNELLTISLWRSLSLRRPLLGFGLRRRLRRLTPICSVSSRFHSIWLLLLVVELLLAPTASLAFRISFETRFGVSRFEIQIWGF